jgi:ferric-dicitrate binding protein FerR (iron transport regulator)
MPPLSKYERFLLLVSLKLDNEASEQELQELNELIRNDQELQAELGKIQQVYNFKAFPLEVPDADKSFSRHIQRLSNHLSKTSSPYDEGVVGAADPSETYRIKPGFRKILFWTSGIAACLIIAFMVGSHTTSEQKRYNNTSNTISTRYGSKSKIELPDGTQVWLNADSKLTYSKDFGNRIREVSLSGEAFFDVQKDPDRPFIIHAVSMDIKVVGTAFNVRSYQNEKTSEATLVRGIIEVSLKENPDRKIILKPSDRIVVQNKASINAHPASITEGSTDTIYWVSKVNAPQSDNTLIENVWKKNSLSFRNETLENVAFRIEHWYNVKVSIRNEELKQVTYSCDFKNESLQQVLDALHFTGKFRYQIVKDSVIISK